MGAGVLRRDAHSCRAGDGTGPAEHTPTRPIVFFSPPVDCLLLAGFAGAISAVGVIWGLGLVARRAINWRIVGLRLAAVIVGLLAMIVAFRLAPPEFGLVNYPLVQVVVSTTFALSLIVWLGMVARCGTGWRIACLVLTAVMSAGSTFFNWFMIHLPT